MSACGGDVVSVPVGAGPDPVRYERAATRLRELAHQLRRHAETVQTTIDDAQALTGTDTWQGGYPTEVQDLMTGWRSELGHGAEALRQRADELLRVATDYAELAAAIRRVAAQAAAQAAG
jgi:uncharacterized protein YukE